MKIFGLGMPELLIILAVALLIFGPKHLPKLGRSLGRTIKGFRDGLGSDKDIVKEVEPEEAPKRKKKAAAKKLEASKEEAAAESSKSAGSKEEPAEESAEAEQEVESESDAQEQTEKAEA